MDELETSRDEVTRVLEAVHADRSALNELIPLVYRELRTMASRFLRREHPEHTFQTTDLVNEAYLRLVDPKRAPYSSKTHFFAASAQAMRRILVDHARSKLRKKRGVRPRRVELVETLQISPERASDVLALDEALEKLEELDPRQARIVELRFFAGMTVPEVAEAMDLSTRTVEREWAMIRAWLRQELG